MAGYTLHVHFADSEIPPFPVSVEPSQSVAEMFAQWLVPLLDARRKSGGGRRDGVAWRFVVQREDGAWEELDTQTPIADLLLPIGATIHALDITSTLVK